MVDDAGQRSLDEMERTAHDVNLDAIFIRSDIQSLKTNIPIPPSPTDLVETTIQVPDALFNFLAWVLLGDCDQ